jgi:cytochrome c biogenesis protein CcmG, thiol:disulfide interchange protein DsbE
MNQKQSAKSSPAARSISGWVIAGVAAAVLAIFAVIAIVSTGDDSSPESGVSETGQVEVTGTPLAEYVADGSDPAVGVIAPELDGQQFDGTAISVKPGRPTLVIFLAHWCPHCQREVPVLTQWESAGGVPEGVDVIGVATGTDPALPNYPPSQWLADEQFPFPVMVDSEASDAAIAFGLSGYPYFVLLDADGKVVQRASGEIDPATLTPVLESLVTP